MKHYISYSFVLLFSFTGVILAQSFHRTPHFLFNDSLWNSLPENIRERWHDTHISQETYSRDKQSKMLRKHLPPWKRHLQRYESDEEKFLSENKFRHREVRGQFYSRPTKPEHEPYQTQQTHVLSDSVTIDWVANYSTGIIPSDDCASAVAIDLAGNIYVTGRSGDDYLTIKYNSSGEAQWAASYNGPGDDDYGSDNYAIAIAVDGSGNVYVTGYSEGLGTSADYATIKYNSSGEEQWVVRYNGDGNEDDYAIALAVDGSGNVYVTGRSEGSGTYDDYATIKYNSSGEEQWVARYNGPSNEDDDPDALAVDGSGNVYVTGYSGGLGTSDDYATIKYNSSGEEQWVARYNGPGNEDDEAYALTVDNYGNVYVTGESDSSGTDDYATIKYNSSGEEQWVARYNGDGNEDDYAIALAVDGSGNVYVTGVSRDSGMNRDYATIKYNSTGIEQWVVRYNGPGNSHDVAYALAVDGSGNVYVTGGSVGSGTSYDYATIKYNSSGEEQWVARYNGPGNEDDGPYALALDGSGNVYVTGESYGGSGTGDDYATIKYNSSGVEQWVARYNGPGAGYDKGKAIAVDGSGNVYVTGGSYGGSVTGDDYATVKYNSSGVEQWVARYNGLSNLADWARAIAVDGSGNVYVTGESFGSGTGRDYATVKYNSSGVEQWVARYNGPGNDDDFIKALAVDGSGNVYVTGSSWGSSTRNDYATIKYNSSGVEQWVARYNGPGNWGDRATALAVDGSGNVYVTGGSDNLGHNCDYTTIKYDSQGVEQWVVRYNGLGNWGDIATALAVDGSGNVYVTGGSDNLDHNFDYATIKYDSQGVEQWVARYSGLTMNSLDEAKAIAVDNSGNVYVTGNSGSFPYVDFVTIKYDTSGVEQWVARYNGPGNYRDFIKALAVDGSGNVYVTGLSDGSNRSFDYATVKYNSSGEEQWVARYNGPRNDCDFVEALAVDGSGNVYMTGNTTFKNGEQYTTVKYRQISTAVEKEAELPKYFVLQQNYPNPFNPSTTIKFDIPKASYVTLKIYNLLGQEVAELVDEKREAGKYEIQFDGSKLASGVYFYQLKAESANDVFIQTKKLILIK